MKIALPLPCQTCGRREPVLVQLDASWWEWTCECGASNAVLSSLDWTKGQRILERATQYREQGDYATSIVFSAMASEAELARLYFKWRKIDTMQEMIEHTRSYDLGRLTDEEAEGEYRNLGRTIAEKVEGVCLLLDDRGIDEFARQSPLAERIEDDYPSLNLGSLAPDIQRAVFWRRNRIVHTGYTGHDLEDAKSAQNVSSVLLELLNLMDRERRLLVAGS